MSDERYRLGYDVLGPVFDAFGRLLLQSAERDRVRRLAFVSRDGAFLQAVTAALIDNVRPASAPQLTYVHLSRISTSLPRLKSLDERAFEEVRLIRAGNLDVRSFLAYYGLDASVHDEALSRNDLSADTRLDDFSRIAPLLSDASFQQRLAVESRSQRDLLASYLRQHAIFENETALVDLGWRGSIVHALIDTFPELGSLRSYYLGYWHELGCRPITASIIEGILADHRRSGGLTEGSAFYLTCLLEGICRADEGTVLRYRQSDDGPIVPVLLQGSAQRTAEQRDVQWSESIRKGVLDFIAGNTRASIDRKEAQRRLRRLAFLPTIDEIAAVEALSHTEGHAGDWSRPIVQTERPSPFRAPRAWLAGLSSPWRSAYVMATGGRMLAYLHMASVSVLLAVPPKVRLWLRRVLLSVARMR